MLKQKILTILLFSPLVIIAHTFFNQEPLDYIDKFSEIAVKEMTISGIPASIILAQGIHESSWGRGDLAVNSNNHFGIKCKKNWEGDKHYHKDDDYDLYGNLIESCFRAYNSVEESYRDHTTFLVDNQRYSTLFELNKSDYINWAIGLQKCGYATDKSYAVKLITLIEKYELYKYDEYSDLSTLTASTDNSGSRDEMGFVANTSDHMQLQEITQAPAPVPIPEGYYEGRFNHSNPVYPNKEVRPETAAAINLSDLMDSEPLLNSAEEEIAGAMAADPAINPPFYAQPISSRESTVLHITYAPRIRAGRRR